MLGLAFVGSVVDVVIMAAVAQLRVHVKGNTEADTMLLILHFEVLSSGAVKIEVRQRWPLVEAQAAHRAHLGGILQRSRRG